MKLLSTLLLILTITSGYAQESPLLIGTTDSIPSHILNEERQLLIYRPAGYSAQKKYPVVYLLDAESQFHFFTGIVNHLSSSYVIPEMIVVGITNTNRNRDYTPTHDASNYDTTNGGGEAFTTFLEKELFPYVESHYATAPYRLLVGHSLGGLVVVNTLLHHTALFNAYVALDPSLWWDKMKLLHQAETIIPNLKLTNKRLYMAISNSLPMGMTDIAQAKRDTTNATIGLRATFLFEDQLKQLANKDLKWQSKYYANESHGSIPLIGAYDALRFIFDFYKRPSFQTLTDNTPAILENHYKMVSAQMGYSILPPESDLAGLAWRSSTMEKNVDRALLFLQLYIKLYPESAAAFESLGELYEQKGDIKQAKAYYEKAKALKQKQ